VLNTSKRGPRQSLIALTVPIFLAVVFAFVAVPYVPRYGLTIRVAAGIYGCFVLLLLLALAPGLAGSREWIRTRMPRLHWFLPLLWCLPYLIYAAGIGDFRWLALARLLVVGAGLPLLYRLWPVRDVERFTWQDLLAALWLIAALLGHQLAGIWTVPRNLDFLGRLFLICISSWSWVFLRPVPRLGYEFSISLKGLVIAGWNFALFAWIALPTSLALHFTQWNPLNTGVIAFGVSFLEIFLFIALLEELFFRGFLQTLVSRSIGSAWVGQVVISCLFGLFHILHAPFPNWRYVLLASVAGWFYGTAFVKSGGLLASALTHAMVDTTWRTFFSKS
jgi:hypothetical protein